MKKRLNCRRSFMAIFIVACFSAGMNGYSAYQDTLQVHFTVFQCDSLIEANTANPDICIMDVRTPGEYVPDHLEGAINRNYYASDFQEQLDQFPRQKMYVLYCQGGTRSGMTFNLMVSMGFPSVVNMLGGISAWKTAGFPTTPDFAPLQMAVTDTVIPDKAVYTGMTDTILLAVTNRANSTLRFTGTTSLEGSEFTTDFDTATTLEGPFDYGFAIYYTPTDTLADSVTFRIESNGGPVQFHIWRTGKTTQVGFDQFTMINMQLRLFPNPAHSRSTFEFYLEQSAPVEITMIDHLGKVAGKIHHNGQKGKNQLTWHAGSLPAGIYFCRVISGEQAGTCKMVKIN